MKNLQVVVSGWSREWLVKREPAGEADDTGQLVLGGQACVQRKSTALRESS
jgi:hypothetical protein